MTSMTALPDPAELAPTRDPAAYSRSRLLSGGFWAMMVLCALCLIAAVLVTTLAPRLFGAHGGATPAPALTSSARPFLTEATSPSPAPTSPAPGAEPVQVAALEDRVKRLEDGQGRALDAAAEALAAAGLSDAAAQPGPFADTLSGFQRVLPASAAAASLRPLALQGAPTRAALAAQLADIAARLSVEARAPAKGAGILAQIAYAVSRVVSVRRLDDNGDGPDAALVKAQRLADLGDLAGAVTVLDAGLPASARPALQAWREQALRRIAIDEAIAGLRAAAVVDLAQARAARP